jgi:hypothetical protein
LPVAILLFIKAVENQKDNTQAWIDLKAFDMTASYWHTASGTTLMLLVACKLVTKITLLGSISCNAGVRFQNCKISVNGVGPNLKLVVPMKAERHKMSPQHDSLLPR